MAFRSPYKYRIFRSISHTEYKSHPYFRPFIHGFVWLLYLTPTSVTPLTRDCARGSRMEDHNVEGEIRGHHVYNTPWTPDVRCPVRCVKSTVTPPFSRIRSTSRMSKISRKFLDKKCDLYSGKYGTKLMYLFASITGNCCECSPCVCSTQPV